MKKIKYLAIFILMITTIIILSTTVKATNGTVNAETVRVRKEPSTKSSILTQLDKGEKVEILEEADGWCKVTVTEDGEKVTGYISADLLDVKKKEENNQEKPVQTPEENNEQPEENIPEENNEQEQVEEPTTNTDTEIEQNKEYNIVQSIKVRVLPLINSREISLIENGTVKVTEIINDWCKIENDTNAGWIRINTLKKSIQNTIETTPEEQPEQQDKPDETVETNAPTTSEKVIKSGYVSVDSLKVRKEANTSSEVVDSLKKNDKVSIIEELDGWYKIKLSDKKGYVSSKYISDKKVEETTSRGGNTSRTDEVSEIQNEQPKETVETPVETTPEASATSTSGNAVVEYAKQYLGYKYVSGGASPSTGFDCSGFTSYVYKQFGLSLYRTSREQIKNGVAVEKSNLQPGDLLIFNGESNKTIGHVGIYIGDGNFIHASNPKGGVKITALSSSYYNIRYVGARRVI